MIYRFKTVRHLPKLLVVFAAAAALLACTSKPPLIKAPPIASEDFSGDWYVIANIPYFAERGKVDSKTTYIALGDGHYRDVFTARQDSFAAPVETMQGKARSLDGTNTEFLSVFNWIFRFKFSVLYHSEDIMLLGHRSRKYGWVMARVKQIPEEQYTAALQVFAENGYDISQFKQVPQYPEQLATN